MWKKIPIELSKSSQGLCNLAPADKDELELCAWKEVRASGCKCVQVRASACELALQQEKLWECAPRNEHTEAKHVSFQKKLMFQN